MAHCRKHGPFGRVADEYGHAYNVCLTCGRVQLARPTRFGRPHFWREAGEQYQPVLFGKVREAMRIERDLAGAGQPAPDGVAR